MQELESGLREGERTKEANDQTLDSAAKSAVTLTRRNLLRCMGYGAVAISSLTFGLLEGRAFSSPGERGGSYPGGLAMGTASSPTTVLANPLGLQMPFWGDGAGWNQQEYWDTIQAGRKRFPKIRQNADLNGDKRAALIARGPAGLLANYYDPGVGQWRTLPEGPSDRPQWSDKDGWFAEPYYETIQMADIDGDGRAELVARAALGIVAFRYHPESGSWISLAGISGLSDANGWYQPQYYSTIQCADIDGDGRAELVARGAGGILAWRYDEVNAIWNRLADGPELSDPKGWDGSPYYATIQCADIDGDGSAELLARGVDGMRAWRYDKTTNAWTDILTTLSDLSDNEGWKGFDYYSTIQTADIDGDGAAELVAQGGATVLAWKYNTTANQWKQLAQGPGNPPVGALLYAPTVQFADVDGDGKYELTGINSDVGVRTWKFNSDPNDPFNPAKQSWTELPTGPQWTKAGGWLNAQFAETMTSARALLPGDLGYTGDGTHPQYVLMGRSALSIQTFRYDVKAQQWIQTSAPLPVFTETQAAAYALLGTRLNPPPGQVSDIRQSYNNALGVSAGLFATWQNQIYNARPLVPYAAPISQRPHASLPPPSGVAQADWDAVTWQIYWELDWVISIYAWFGEIANFINTKGLGESLILTDIGSNYLGIESASSLSVALSILALIAGAFGSILGSPAVEGAIAAAVSGVLSAGIGIAASSLPGGGGAYTQAYDQLVNDLDASFEAAVTGNNNLLAAILGGQGNQTVVPPDYGLLRLMGEAIQSENWTWTPEQFNQMFLAAERGYAKGVFQALLAAQPWYPGYSDGSGAPSGYPGAYVYTSPQQYAISLATDGSPCDFPPTNALSAVFDPISSENWHPLHVPLAEFFNAENGWQTPPWSDYESNSCPGPVASPLPKPPLPRLNTDIRMTVKLRRNASTGRLYADIALKNQGLTAAENAEILLGEVAQPRIGKRVLLGGAPTRRTRLGTGKVKRITLTFPEMPAGRRISLRLYGRYVGGVFGGTLRLTVP